MAMTTNIKIDSSLFCMCGGLWTTKDHNVERVLVCPLCGTEKPIPSDTSMFQLRFK